MQAFFGTGLLGGFTTYSALALEIVTLPAARGLAYGGVTVIAGVALATLGVALGGKIGRSFGGAR